MCIHTRLIRNPYTLKPLRVSCGKCEACLQAKAIARANRIRNHSKFGYVPLFVTLTYSNDFIPYIRRSDLEEGNLEIPIYRSATVRYYRDREIVKHEPGIVDMVYIGDDPINHYDTPSPVGKFKDSIGVIYYPDLQNFFKRLRINLKRNNYDKAISYFACGEYGSFTKRPHWHLLLYVPTSDVETLQSYIVKSWSYADKARTKEYIEVAKNAASYVASYISGSHSLPSLLQNHAFKQAHSMSKGFGTHLKSFSLASLLSNVDRSSMSYNVRITQNGVPSVHSLPIPEYVINRFFPKFKGYSLLSDNEIHQLLLRTHELSQCVSQRNKLFKWTVEDERKYHRRLLSIRKIFMDELGLDFQRFEIYYPKFYTSVWNCYKSTLLKLSYNGILFPNDWLSFYENANEVFYKKVHSEFLQFLDDSGIDVNGLCLDPNNRLDIVRSSLNLTEIYYKTDKNKRVVNYSMAHLGHLT